MSRQKVTRIPQELVFDTASTLYLAQAGPHIQERYDVSIVHALRPSFFEKNERRERSCVVQRNETKRIEWHLLARGMFSMETGIVSLCRRVRVTK